MQDKHFYPKTSLSFLKTKHNFTLNKIFHFLTYKISKNWDESGIWIRIHYFYGSGTEKIMSSRLDPETGLVEKQFIHHCLQMFILGHINNKLGDWRSYCPWEQQGNIYTHTHIYIYIYIHIYIYLYTQ